MAGPGNINLTFLRNIKKDIYENIRSKKKRKSRKHSHKHKHHKECRDNDNSSSYDCCRSKNICDRLCLTPPDGACEEKNVKHQFEIVLGDCKVVRDVNIIHKITANLEHHIKENIICEHDPCTKHTHEEICKTDDGKCCKVNFPDCDDDIKIIEDTQCNNGDSSQSDKNESNSSDKTESTESESKDSKLSKHHKKHNHKKHHKKHHHKKHHHKSHCHKSHKKSRHEVILPESLDTHRNVIV